MINEPSGKCLPVSRGDKMHYRGTVSTKSSLSLGTKCTSGRCLWGQFPLVYFVPGDSLRGGHF